MHWFQSLVFLTTGCFFNHAFPNVRFRTKEDICLSKINWCILWKQIDKLNEGGMPQECSLMDKSDLCDPAQMKITNISEDVPVILQILNETAALFEMEDTPFSGVRDFLEYNCVTQDELKICEDSRCAWQVVHQDTLVILQQLEYDIAASQLH